MVEDDADQRDIRRLLIEMEGHEVVAVESHADAVAGLATTPDVVVMDLNLPGPQDGMNLIRTIRSLPKPPRIVVLTGWPEALRDRPEQHMVSTVLTKPCRSRTLLDAIAQALLCLCLLLGAATAKEFTFQASGDGEVIVDLELRSPGSDWARAGCQAAVATIRVDDGPPQHVFVFGEKRSKYGVFLGRLRKGAHKLSVTRDAEHSAAESTLEVDSAKFHEDSTDVAANAPILYARADSIGQFSDVPLVVYAERQGGVLTYTVIFSNEDGGHSTKGLLARWGRTTDIEYVYRVEPAGAFIQTRDHKDVPYAGPLDGKHPKLLPVTKNNMVEPGESAIRMQIAPVLVELGSHSREIVMDRNPWTYQIASKELVREGRLTDITDPSRYLYLEAKVNCPGSRIAFKVRLVTETTWRTSHQGDKRLAIERPGWVRAAIPLPAGTGPKQIAAFAYDCLAEKDGAKATCQLEQLSPAFFLTPDYLPGRAFRLPRE